MLGLTLEINKESGFNGLKCYEPINIEILDKILSSDLLLDEWKENNNYKFSNERQQLEAYRKIIINGNAEVIYNFTQNLNFGRVYPKDNLGLCTIRREIRHTLTKNKLIDIDIINSGPSIILNICKMNNIKCKYLERYVENRDKYLDQIIKKFNVNKDIAKNLFISLINDGSFEGWIYRNSVKNIDPTKFINKFIKEIKKINELIVQNNPILLTEIKNKKDKDKKKTNNNGALISYFYQEIERRILETIFCYCKSKLIIKNNIVVLCFDGIMIEKINFYEELINELENIIFEKFNMKLKLKVKPLDEDYLEILDKHIISQDQIIKKELPNYNINLIIKKDEDFELSILNELFFNDIAELGEEKYVYYFNWTKSFQYYNNYHAHFYVSNQIYKIFKNEIVKYESPNNFEHLKFTLNKKIYKFTNLFLECRFKRSYSTFEFNPNLNINLKDKYNLFNGFNLESNDNKTYDLEIINIFINHVKYICRDDENVSQYLLNWFSHIIQKPFIKTNVAIVIFSLTEGVGKNLISDIFSNLINGYSAKFRDTASLTDRFNGEMMAKLFVVGDEIKAKAQEIINELKDIITRVTENIEFKGKDKILLSDYKNYFFTTNNENVFKISNTDRRFMFIEAPEEIKNIEYYTKLKEFCNNKEKLKHLFNYLISRDITNFSPKQIIETEYKKRIIMANMPAYIKFVKDQYDILSKKEYNFESGEYDLIKQWRVPELYKESIQYAHKNKMQSLYTENTFNKQFKKIFSKFHTFNKDRQSIYIFPSNKDSDLIIDECIENNYLN